MKMNPFLGTFFLPALLLLSTSCTKEVRSDPVEKNLLSASNRDAAAKTLETELLKSVRRATARFHSTTQATQANYHPEGGCVSVPGLGGMGYHWVNEDLVDEVFEPLKPEAVLYATGPGGNLRLVAGSILF